MSRKSRLRIIPDRYFSKFYNYAMKSENKTQYLNNFLNISSDDYIKPAKLNLEYEDLLFLLEHIYNMANLSFSELLDMIAITKSQFSHKFCVPLTTVNDWYSGRGKCPGYYRLLLMHYYKIPVMPKYYVLKSDFETTHKSDNPNNTSENDIISISHSDNITNNQGSSPVPDRLIDLLDEDFDKYLDTVTSNSYFSLKDFENESANLLQNQTDNILDAYDQHLQDIINARKGLK